MEAKHDVPEETLDPDKAFKVYLQQSKRASLDLSVASRGNLIIWGVAWLVGYGALWVSARQTTAAPEPWAFVVFGVCLAGAFVLSAVLGARSARQVSGPSALAGALFGWAGFLAFGGGMTMTAIICLRYGLSGEATGVLYNAVAALILGILYLTGGALWSDRTMYIVGATMIVLGVIGTVIGVPTGYLAMALIGGGLMIAQYGYETWRRRRVGTPPSPEADHA